MRIGFYIDAKIGDSVVTLPALRAIKQAFPTSRLFVFTNAIGENLYSPLKWIDEVILYQHREQICQRSLDYLISTNCDKNTISQFKTSNVKKILTYLKPYNLFDPRIKSIFISHRCKPQNVKQNSLDLINLIARPKILLQDIKDYRLRTLPHHQQHIAHFLSPLPALPKIMLNPFGFAAQQNLSLKDYECIALKLLANSCIILPTFAEKTQEILQSFSQTTLNHPHFFLFENDCDLLNLVELISKVNLLISPSTGNIHIADNLGIPSIGLFSHKDTLMWGGENMHYIVLDNLRADEAIKQVLLQIPKLLQS